jgi:hypothetical protein
MSEPTPAQCEALNATMYRAICVSAVLLEENMVAAGSTLQSLTPLVLTWVMTTQTPEQLSTALITAGIIVPTVPPSSALKAVRKGLAAADLSVNTLCCWNGEEWLPFLPGSGYVKGARPCKLEPAQP